MTDDELRDFAVDPGKWVEVPCADGELPGRRRMWEGVPGSDWEGCVMTLEITSDE